jgi:hypothetical protein
MNFIEPGHGLEFDNDQALNDEIHTHSQSRCSPFVIFGPS